MSWLNVNFNEGLSNLKGQLTNLANNVLADGTTDDSGMGQEPHGELQKLVAYQENEIKRLQRENSDIMKRIASNTNCTDVKDDWNWDLVENTSESYDGAPSQIKTSFDDDLLTKIQELQREKEELILSLEQLDLDCQRTTDKLVSMKDELLTENNSLKLQHEDLNKENTFLRTSIEQEQKRISNLEYEKDTKDAEISRLRAKLEKSLTAEKCDASLDSMDGIMDSDSDYNKLEALVAEYSAQIQIYENELKYFRSSKVEGTGDTCLNSSKCFDMLLNSIKKSNAIEEATSFEQSIRPGEVEKRYEELVNVVATTLTDYKSKIDLFNSDLKHLREENSILALQKNGEFDELIGDIKELNKKLRIQDMEIQHYKDECNAISSNNEELIKKFHEIKKNDNILHSIPEMNEQYEKQLEKCFKRIEELEYEVDSRSSDEINELKEQLVVTRKEIQTLQEYNNESKLKYHQLEDDYNSLKIYLENTRKRFRECYNEKEELEGRVKMDDENIAEKNLSLENLHEEVETLTATVAELRRQNEKNIELKEKLERELEEAHKEITDLKEEMTSEINESIKKDQQMSEFSGTVDTMEHNVRKLKRQVEVLTKDNEELLTSRSRYITNYREFRADVEKLIMSYIELKETQQGSNIVIDKLLEEKKSLLAQLEQMKGSNSNSKDMELKMIELEKIIGDLRESNSGYSSQIDSLTVENTKLGGQLREISNSRNELIQLIQQKHLENITYHNEIQRLQQLVLTESEKYNALETQSTSLENAREELVMKKIEVEKLQEQNTFLREKCAVLAENLLQEQTNCQKVLSDKSNATEREVNLQRQLDSLRQHLIEVQETHTREVQAAEINCVEMKRKLQEVVEKEKNSSNRFTSANIRANQQVEALQTNLQLITNQRDEFKRKVSELEDQMEKQNAALCNLQIVLEQFQREKDKVIFEETERMRRKVSREKDVQNILQQQINDLKNQLEESKAGLKAAVRLTDQVDSSKRQVAVMKEEVAKLQEQLQKSDAKYDKLLNQTDGRVDKMLVKNLVIGLVTCSNNLNKDQNQILKIISSVLDFNQQDIDKVHLNKRDQNTWFSALLHPQALEAHQNNTNQDSLSRAFVQFLEAESKPRNLPNLLEASTSSMDATEQLADASGQSSRKTSIRKSPLLLNEILLPTFSDFSTNRSSSSILKDVLKDNISGS